MSVTRLHNAILRRRPPAPAAAPAVPTIGHNNPPSGATIIRADPYPVIPENYMIGIVEGEDRTPQRERIGGGGYTHASSLMGICTRQHAIAHLYDVNLLKPVTGADRVIWALGRAAEKHWRTQFIKGRRRVGIYGVWKCVCEKSEHRGFHRKELSCQSCGGGLDHYHEPPLFDHASRTVGNPDLSFFFGRFMVVNEIKSMEGDAFNALTDPKGDHVHQAILYRRLYRMLGFEVHKNVIITYVSKRYNRERRRGSTETWRPYKEYRIDASAPQYEAMVDTSLAEATEIRNAVANKALPPRTACASQTCAKAKDCPVATYCWSL